MNKNETPGAHMRRLGRILYLLSLVLGVAELGIVSRAGEWLGYAQLGQLGSFYTAALFVGVMVAPLIRNLRVATVISVLLSALPVAGIGATLLMAIPPERVFGIVLVLWPLSAVGAGILDNVQSSLGVLHKTQGRNDAVAMLAMRHVGTLGASILTLAAVSANVSAGVQYIVVGAFLVVPVLVGRAMPHHSATKVNEVPREVTGRRPASFLLVMGAFAAAAVLPVSLTWAWAEPVMRELHADPHIATFALMAFVIAQGIACVVYFKRSAKHAARKLVLGGLWIAAIGVGLLALTVVQTRSPFLSDDVSLVVVMAGFALFGWGVAPLPMVVMGRVSELPMKLSTRQRISRTVLVQCALVAGGNQLFGVLASQFSGVITYVGTAVVCVGALLLCMRLLPATK
jgi:hypothetical protein